MECFATCPEEVGNPLCGSAVPPPAAPVPAATHRRCGVLSAILPQLDRYRVLTYCVNSPAERPPRPAARNDQQVNGPAPHGCSIVKGSISVQHKPC